MKKALLILFIFSSLLIQAANTYVATTGSDITGNGTVGNPWQTAKYGIEHTSAGDTCFFGIGTFVVTTTIYPPLGVNFVGVDTTSTVFNVTQNITAISMWSASVTTGNHYIANIKFNGNFTAYNAIEITRRSSVIINKCAFRQFNFGGIYAFDGFDDLANSPAISGINVYNSQFVDCSRYLSTGGFGAIWHRGVKDYEMLNTTAIANYLPGDSAGFLVKGSRMKNVRISNCTFKIYGHDDDAKWAFAIEYNHNLGGVQIDNCDFQGVLDFAGNFCMKGEYDYSLWLHHNTIGHTSLSSRYQDGVYLENYPLNSSMSLSDAIIEDNTFKYLTRGIVFMKVSTGIQSQFLNNTIRRNLFHNMGMDASGSYGWGITWTGNGGFLRNTYLYNNTFIASTLATRSQLVAINLPVRNSTVDVYKLVNNIMIGFDNSPIMTDGSYTTGTIDSLYLQNNIIYQNGNSNDPKWWGVVPTNIFSSGNLKVDPMFNGSFGLQEGSPAIDAGINVGLPFFGTAPEIGAYEYIPPVIGKRVAKYSNKTGRYFNKIGRY